MTQLSFSAHAVDITLPQGWPELSQVELQRVYALSAIYDSASLPVAVFAALTGMRIVRELEEGFLLLFRYRRKRARCVVTPEAMASVLKELDWLFEPGRTPVRLEMMRGARAVDAQLHNVQFGVWLRLENLYQSFVDSRRPEILLSIASLLYPGLKLRKGGLTAAEQMNVLNWMVQIKNLFAGQFSHLFGASGGVGQPSMLEIMNNEIRALTGGDVTREDIVLECDVWRALTELDYKAKEAKDFNREMEKARNGR